MKFSRKMRALAAAAVFVCLYSGKAGAASTETITVDISQVLASSATYDMRFLNMTAMVWVSSITYYDGYTLNRLMLVNPPDFDTPEKEQQSIAAGKFIMAFTWYNTGLVRNDGVTAVGFYGLSLPTVFGSRSNSMRIIRVKKSGP